MPIKIATVRDVQSAEYLKSRALVEQDPSVELALWQEARQLAPDSATLHSHEAFALLNQGRFDEVVRVLGPALVRWPRFARHCGVVGDMKITSKAPQGEQQGLHFPSWGAKTT